MDKYSHSQRHYDRPMRQKFGVSTVLIGALALAAGLTAGCAATAPETSPEPLAVPPTVPESPIQVLADATPEEAPPVALQPGVSLTYVVKSGDTLWGIAEHFLLDPWQWPQIWIVNDQVRNPHLIYPGDVLQLSEVDGKPRLGLDVERVSPRIRELPLEGAIPTIAFDNIREFLRGPRLVTSEELKTAPYLLSFANEHIIGGEGALIYVRKLPQHEPWSWALVRAGDPYHDPDDQSIIGYEALPIGAVEVREPGEPATAVLSQTYREAFIGDRLLPVEPEAFQNDFYPHAPDHPVGGQIIGAFGGLSQISQFQIVAINRGSRNGLEPGHVLQILQGGMLVDDPYGKKKVRVPDQPAGLLLIFKVTPRLSYGLVMTVTRPAHLLDKVETPRATR